MVRLWEPDEDWEEPRSSGLAREERYEHGWCAACGMFQVDGYYCVECALENAGYAARFNDDRQSVTATIVGRAQQRRVDRAMAYEQMNQLWSITEANVRPVAPEDGEHIRSYRLRVMRAENNPPCQLPDAKVPGPKFVFNAPDWYRRKR